MIIFNFVVVIVYICGLNKGRIKMQSRIWAANYLKMSIDRMIGLVVKILESDVKAVIQFSPALRAARTEQPAVAEMPTHPFVHPATRLKP